VRGRGEPDGSSGPTTAFPPLSREALPERISREITKAILRGDMAAESFLPTENELGDAFGVSRPVIREAVKQLSVLGLVQSRQGQGTRVAARTAWRHFAPELLAARLETEAGSELLLELLELRRIVEVDAAALAARRANDADLAAIRRQVGASEVHLDDLDAFVEDDVAFHATILLATRNQLLAQLIEQFKPLLRAARRVSASSRPGGVAVSQQEHRAILDALERRDESAARAAMSEHLSWTADLDLQDWEAHLTRTSDEASKG
jgi:GntR family transcriptional repressor for pyruvate dehydrogenase complex